MTSLQQAAWAPMDAPTLDEKMDVAPAPFQQLEVDDIDLEIEPIENQTLIPPSDNLMDDVSDLGAKVEDAMQGGSTELLEDQDMQDDVQGEVQVVENELDMGDNAVDEQEDDIIYDAEGEDTVADPQVQLKPPEVETPAEAEEDLFDFDDTDNIDNSASNPPPHQVRCTKDAHEQADADAQEEIQSHSGDAHPDDHFKPASDPVNVDHETTEAQQVASLQAASEPQEQDEEQMEEHEQEEEQHQHLNGLHTEAPEHIDSSATASPVDEVPSGVESLADIEINAIGPHFVTLTYKGIQYPLFSDGAASDGALFPLSDTNLLFEPLERLLEACKERVFTEEQDHLDEVVFTIPVFAMKYCQDSKFASEHSLWDILRLYVKFKQNEGAKSIEPLDCSLYVQTCLDTQFRWLITEAHKQIAYSSLSPEYVGVGNALSQPTGHEHDISFDEDSFDGEEQEQEHKEALEEAPEESPEEKPKEEHKEEHGDTYQDALEPAAQEAEADENVDSANDESAQPSEENDDKYDEGADLPAGAHVAPGNQPQTDPTMVDDIAPVEEQDADQPTEFFEEAYEDEQGADAVEYEEEQLEDEEDDCALEQAEAANEQALKTGHQYSVDENEQLDAGEEPQPFKIAQEAEEIALEDQDLTVQPGAPLGADEDPDALLEGRPTDAPHELEDSKTNYGHRHSASPTGSTPTTPTKSKSTKRKAEEDDDDLIELDFDTPQLKRLRQSPPP